MCSNHRKPTKDWRVKNLRKPIGMVSIIVLITASILLITPLNVNATNGVVIVSITPENRIGKVGDSIRLLGTINKTDGLYRIWFAHILAKEANATGTIVDTTFFVPQILQGNYTITLQDVENNINATTSFVVQTAFLVKALVPTPPLQLQENDTFAIHVNVTGGTANTVYHANVTVYTPAPSNEVYWAVISLSNTTNTGSGSAMLYYPQNFTNSVKHPHTNYVGTYMITFNTTLGSSLFVVGITNSTEYHRGQTLNVKAAGYTANETVTIKILKGSVLINATSINATEGGFVLWNWHVPLNASMGNYAVNITSSVTSKNPRDIQSFTIPGFDINVTTRNRAGEAVASVAVQIFEGTVLTVNGTSNTQGLLQTKLELGSYTLKAFHKGEKVYESVIAVTGAGAFNILCNLTNLRIRVFADVDGAKIRMPEVRIRISPGSDSLVTNLTGVAVAKSLVSHLSYTLNFSRYNYSFLIQNLSTLYIGGNPPAWYDLNVTCPVRNLQINASNVHGELIDNAKVKVSEMMGGIRYEGTISNGFLSINCLFGRYKIELYDASDFKVNETTVDLFTNQSISWRNLFYGLTLRIRVVDHFGQPISNVNVTLKRLGLKIGSGFTRSDGSIVFSDFSGRAFQVEAYLFNQGSPHVAKEFLLDKLNVENWFVVKLDKYVVLAGFFIETSHLASVILVVLTVTLVLVVELLRRRRYKALKAAET